jgi:hypothetical protein
VTNASRRGFHNERQPFPTPNGSAGSEPSDAASSSRSSRLEHFLRYLPLR